MATIDDSTLQAVANSNYKAVGEVAAVQLGQLLVIQTEAFRDAQISRKRLDIMAEASLAQQVKNLNELDPVEAMSEVKAFTGNDVASQISALGAAISGIQQLVKTAQTTPPVYQDPATAK